MMLTKVDRIEAKGAGVAHGVLPLLSAWDIYLSYLFWNEFTFLLCTICSGNLFHCSTTLNEKNLVLLNVQCLGF